MAAVSGLVGDVALASPVSAFLLAVGALLIAVASGVFAYLALGALASLVTPS